MESENLNMEVKEQTVAPERSLNYSGLIPVFILLLAIVARISYGVYRNSRQKTRNPQERRQYVGSRTRQSFSQPDPIIYLSPSNMPPPPKYEAMAPPSYDEVVGVHYPSYQPQPITQPITTAMAQTSSTSCSPTISPPTTNNTVADEPATVTVTSETRRTSTAATVTASA